VHIPSRRCPDPPHLPAVEEAGGPSPFEQPAVDKPTRQVEEGQHGDWILKSSSPMWATQSKALASRSMMAEDAESQSEAVAAVIPIKVPASHTPLHIAYVPIPHRIPVELE
jgi:hypothetical protein